VDEQCIYSLRTGYFKSLVSLWLAAKFELGNSICVENITFSQLDCAIMTRQWMAGKAWTCYVYLKLW